MSTNSPVPDPSLDENTVIIPYGSNSPLEPLCSQDDVDGGPAAEPLQDDEIQKMANDNGVWKSRKLWILAFFLLALFGTLVFFFADWFSLKQEAKVQRGIAPTMAPNNNAPDIGGSGGNDSGGNEGGDGDSSGDNNGNGSECDDNQHNQQEAVECPYTTEDVAVLQTEIDRLEDSNEELTDLLVEYQSINSNLNLSIEELKLQNQNLKDSNDAYAETNTGLNATLTELKDQNEFLAEQVEIYKELNGNTNTTAGRLQDQIDRLMEQVDELNGENDRLEGLVNSLSNETTHLSELNDLLQSNVDRLEEKVYELQDENDRLEVSITDLQSISSFLDETADNLGDAYDEVVAFLAEQISTNRVLVMETLENTYHQRVANWDCALRDHFVLEDFANDGSIPIPEDRFEAVMAYVEERVLSDLCLGNEDFEQYMGQRYEGQDITTNRLVTSVQRYTWSALDYYFPEGDNEGLTPEDWAAVEYDCGNLPIDKKFEMDS